MSAFAIGPASVTQPEVVAKLVSMVDFASALSIVYFVVPNLVFFRIFQSGLESKGNGTFISEQLKALPAPAAGTDNLLHKIQKYVKRLHRAETRALHIPYHDPIAKSICGGQLP